MTTKYHSRGPLVTDMVLRQAGCEGVMEITALCESQRDHDFKSGQGDERVALSEIVSALSFALDLTEDARPGHALRSCLLGMRIAAELGLPDNQLSSLYYALLLKDMGCSCNANLLREMVGGDDRTIKRMVKLEDWRHPSLSGLKLLWDHAGTDEPF